jgi:hypothetical protein
MTVARKVIKEARVMIDSYLRLRLATFGLWQEPQTDCLNRGDTTFRLRNQEACDFFPDCGQSAIGSALLAERNIRDD